MLKDGTAYSGLGPLTPIRNQENVPTDMTTGQSDRLQLRFPLSKDSKLLSRRQLKLAMIGVFVQFPSLYPFLCS